MVDLYVSKDITIVDMTTCMLMKVHIYARSKQSITYIPSEYDHVHIYISKMVQNDVAYASTGICPR